MSWRLRHTWVAGARIVGLELATCRDCGLLRSTLGDVVQFITRDRNEPERVKLREPPCISAPDRSASKRRGRRDKYGCELGAEARARALEAVLASNDADG